MSDQKSFWRILTERGPLTALSVACAILFGIAAPASAQFFNFGGPPPPPPRGGYYSPFGDVFPGAPQAQRAAADYSHAPAPARRETPAERNILVLGDSMSDWLGYGLEDAFSESPEFGVIRKSKTISGLIKYQPKGEPADWVAAAKQIVANEKPDAIVVMLGLHDRIPIREPVVEKKADAKPAAEPGKKVAKKDARKEGDTKSGDTKTGDKDGDKPVASANKPDDDAAADDKTKAAAKSDGTEAEAAPDEDDQAAPAVEQAQRPGNGVYDFREERWTELYAKKIAEMIAVLKTKGVPILWVGLPAVKGTKSTSDMLFLDSLYRDGAGKAGITYVDIWDGFVDEQGRYIQQGPDFEGQIRRLRSYDGVYFTKAGARKLALFTEREIRRVLASRSGPVALPSETQSPVPDASNIRPGVAGPRPLAGPVIPLVASSVGTDELMGGNGSRPASVDALAARTLVKGEALSAPAGRADDFSWPRRDVGSLTAPAGDAAVAGIESDGVAKPAPPKPRRQQQRPAGLGFFGFDSNRGWPQRPRYVPRQAEVPGFFTR